MAGLEPKFILKEPKSETATLIYVCINWKSRRIKLSIAEYIEPRLWDFENHRPISKKSDIRNLKPLEKKRIDILSHRLDEIEYFINDKILDLKQEKNLSIEALKETLLIYLGRKEERKPIRFLDYYAAIVEQMENGTYLTDKGGKYSKGTIKSYKSNLVLLREFESNYRYCMFEDIDMNYYNHLITYCNRNNFKLNTTGAVIKRIKAIMRQAYESGLHTNDIFRSSVFKAIKEKVYNIYLTKEELNRLYELKLTGKDEVYRDVFLIGCYTAQRFSDYKRISPEHIQETSGKNKVIDIVQVKTKQRVLIPFLFPQLDILLKKYDYKVPKVTEQPFNRAIKTIGEKAKINTDIILTESIGGRVKERTVKKHKLISTHTARRTGATNLFLMGYSSMQIMKITGHTTEESFLTYIKVSLEENIDKMISKEEMSPMAYPKNENAL